MRSRYRSLGLTLIEVLASLALILLVLGIITNLLSRVGRAFIMADERLEKLETVAVGLRSLQAELEGAMTLVEPTSATAVNQVILEQISPEYQFPTTVVAGVESVYPSPPGWDWSAINMDTVRYFVDAEGLKRTVDGGNPRLMAEEVTQLAAKRFSQYHYQVIITLDHGGVISQLAAEAWRP